MSDSDHDQDDHGYKKKKKKKQVWDKYVPPVVQTPAPAPAEVVPDKKRKHSEDEVQAQPEASPAVDAPETKKQKKARMWNENKEREKAGVPAVVAEEDAVSTKGVDWAARQLEKKKKKKERQALLERDEEAKSALQEKLDEKAGREKANEKLKKKGKLTKKQKYLAAKAAKKAQASKKEFNLSEALATAKLEKLDPRAVSCFLTGLPYLATEKHITAHFSDIGPCTVQLQKDPDTGRCDGRGFVTFTAAENALQASTYTGSTLQGRWIKIRLCEPRDSGASNTSNQGPGEKPEGCLSVVVKCDKSITEASLKRFFNDCDVANVSRMMDRDTGEFRGTAFMDFEDTNMVDRAVAKNGQTIKGTEIRVRYKMEMKKGGPQEGSTQQEKKKKEHQEAPKAESGRVAAHNRAPPVPKPAGKATKFDSDSDEE